MDDIQTQFQNHNHDGLNSKRLTAASFNGTPVYSVAFGHAVAGGTEYFSLATFSGTEALAQTPITSTGTISNLYVQTNTAQPGTGSAVITMRKNGVNQAVTLTIAAGSAAGVFSDITHTFSVVKGDLINISLLNNASTASAAVLQYGFQFAS